MPINTLKRGLLFPRLGTIRKGEQVPVIDKTTRQPKINARGEAIMRPVEKPYWVFHVDPTAQGVADAIYAAYGTKEISELNVFLPHTVARDNFDYWLEAYTASQLISRSDGTKVVFLRDPKTGEILIRDGKVVAHAVKPSVTGDLVKDIPIGGSLPYTDGMIVAQVEGSGLEIVHKATGRLQVVVRELRRMAIFTVITGSLYYDIPKIASALELVDQISRFSNRPANTIPLKLRRVPIEVPYRNEKNEAKRGVKHFIELEPVSDVVAGLLTAYEGSPFAFSITANQPAALPEPAYDEVEDYGEAAEEVVDVHPEPVAPGSQYLTRPGDAVDVRVPKQAPAPALTGNKANTMPRPATPAPVPAEPEPPFDDNEDAAEYNPLTVRFITPAPRQWPAETIKVVIENGFAANDFAARGMLNLSNLPINAPDEVLLGWCELYREKRPRRGTSDKDAPTAQDAAKAANTEAEFRWGAPVD